MNKYFELIEDSDLDVGEYKVEVWIYVCPECKALFSSKAIYGRTIFPWFGYHPNDGNCRVLTDKTRTVIGTRVGRCKCLATIQRVRSVEELKTFVEYNKVQLANENLQSNS